MRPLVLIAPLALLACSPQADTAPETAEPAAPAAVLAGVDLNEPVRALGTEPFWSVEMTGEEMIYTGVDRPERRAPQPPTRVQGTMAAYEGMSAEGPLSVTLTATECSDGMSDRVYPLTAIVKVGEETLTGCAASAAAIMGAGEGGAVTAPAVQPAA